MPEIKNNFFQGKMNKDLDERLVPNGQYRHALNIEVSTSEGSDVGTIQNLKGNEAIGGGIPADQNFKCVGSIADEKSNTVYWFLSGDSKDAIVGYDTYREEQFNVVVDLKKGTGDAILKFNKGQITGINVIDNTLCWTDGENEPKLINIHRCKTGSDTFNDHTKLIINGVDYGDLEEEHITTIKKKPSIAPHVKINSTTDDKTSGLFEKTFPRFAIRYKYIDNQYSAIGPFTNVVFNPAYTGDYDVTNAFEFKEGHNKAMSNSIKSIELTDFILSDIPKDVIEVDILYKQENSTVVYSVHTIKNTDASWDAKGSIGDTAAYDDSWIPRSKGSFLITTENIYAAIPENQMLRPWDNVPRKALAQDVTGNRIVYGNYVQGYDLKDSNQNDIAISLSAYLEDRDTLKLFSDGGKESIKSQRDYQIGVVYGDKYGRETPVFTSQGGSVKAPWENTVQGKLASSSSIISAIVNNNHPTWAEYFKFYVKETSGEYYNLVMDKVYKPQASTESTNKDDHIWLGFSSSDRNKVAEDDYIILKKIVDSSSSQIDSENRYKILDIKNEAPDAIAYGFSNLGAVDNGGNQPLTGNGVPADAIFADPNLRIDKEVDTLEINLDNWQDEGGFNFVDADGPTSSVIYTTGYRGDVYVSWYLDQAPTSIKYSKRYKVDRIDVTGQNKRKLKLAETISTEDALMVYNPSNTNLIASDATFVIERKDKLDGIDFSGKFFVKIAADKIIKSNLMEESISGNADAIKASYPMFYYLDAINTTDFNQTGGTGMLNAIPASGTPNNTPHGAHNGNLTNSQSEWNTLNAQTIANIGDLTTGFVEPQKKMFIDSMHLKAVQTGNTNYAKAAGPGLLENYYTFQDYTWGATLQADIDNDGDEYGWIPVNIDEDYGVDVNNHLVTKANFNQPSNQPPHFDETRITNGMPGIVEIDDTFGLYGARGFVEKLGDNKSDSTYGGLVDVPGEKYYLHLSFLAPGVDLHDGSWTDATGLNSTDLVGYNSIARDLQGVWGGGVFTDNAGQNKVEFEGNYNELGEALSEAPKPSVGRGYSEEHRVNHERQWDPTYPYDPGNKIKDFIDNLKPGSQFKFKDDSSNIKYTIKSVKAKKLYNHTSWRSNFQWNGTQLEQDQTSIEYYAVRWAEEFSQNGQTHADTQAVAASLKSQIVNFGKANNRRICYIIELDKNPLVQDYNPVAGGNVMPDANSAYHMEFINDNPQPLSSDVSKNSAIFETEPKKSSELNIFHEAGQSIPLEINEETREVFAPSGSRVEIMLPSARNGQRIITEDIYVRGWETGSNTQNEVSGSGTMYTYPTITNGMRVNLSSINSSGVAVAETNFNRKDAAGLLIDYSNATIRFYREDGSYTSARIIQPIFNSDYYWNTEGVNTGFYINPTVDTTTSFGIHWHNCFSFGDGVESNRIRDDFNAMTITNGPRVSTTLNTTYQEEERKNGLIYSGLFNSNSGVNNLNQFIQAEKITKDINPTYGSIQKLYSRKTDLIAFCEDRVVKILANKDALFNADGNAQLVSTSNVLGQTMPFSGDFGISTNPESFAEESFRAYFTDASRGAVLRLSMDGLTPISDSGMHDYFRDNLIPDGEFIGSYDAYKKEYNLTLKSREDFEELILNNYIEDGEPLISIIQGQNIIDSSYSSYSYETETSYGELSSRSNKIANPTFSHDVEIIHHPEIPAGHFQSYYAGTNDTSAEDVQYQNIGLFLTRGNTLDDNDWNHGQNPFLWNPGYGVGQYSGSGSQYDFHLGSTWTMYDNNGNALAYNDDISAFPWLDGNRTKGCGFPSCIDLSHTITQTLLGGSATNNYSVDNALGIDIYDIVPGLATGLDGPNADPWSDYYTGGLPIGVESGICWFNARNYDPMVYMGLGDFNTTLSSDTQSGNKPGIVFAFVDQALGGGISAKIKFKNFSDGSNPVNGTTDILDPDIIAAYPSATNKTFFHGEEVEINFTAYWNDSPNLPDGSTYDFSHHFQSFRIQLYDGNTQLTNAQIDHNAPGAHFQPNTSNPGYNQASHGFSSYAHQWFPHIGGHPGQDQSYKCKFRFVDPNNDGTVQTVAVQDLRVEIMLIGWTDDADRWNPDGSTYEQYGNGWDFSGTNMHADYYDRTQYFVNPGSYYNDIHDGYYTAANADNMGLDTPYAYNVQATHFGKIHLKAPQEVIVRDIGIKKIRRVTDLYVPVQPGANGYPAIPASTVPAWAEVKYYAVPDWNNSGEHGGNRKDENGDPGFDWWYGARQVYGDENPEANAPTIDEVGDASAPGGTQTYTWIDGANANNGVTTVGNSNAGTFLHEDGAVKLCGFSSSMAATSSYLHNVLAEAKNIDDWYALDIHFHPDTFQFTDHDLLLLSGVVDPYEIINTNDPNYANIQWGGSYTDVDNAYITSHLDGHPNYPEFSFGRVDGGNYLGGAKSFALCAARDELTNSVIKRCIWKATEGTRDMGGNYYGGAYYTNPAWPVAESSLPPDQHTGGNGANNYNANRIHIYTWGGNQVVSKVVLRDITAISPVSEPTTWHVDNPNLSPVNNNGDILSKSQTPHIIRSVNALGGSSSGFSNSTGDNGDGSGNDITLRYSKPTLYYNNGKLCFDINGRDDSAVGGWLTDYQSRYFKTTGNWGLQPPAGDSYKLEFTISKNPDTNTIGGTLGMISVKNDIDPSTGEFNGIIVRDIVDEGDYVIRFNFDDTFTPFVEQEPGTNPIVITTDWSGSSIDNTISNNAGHITISDSDYLWNTTGSNFTGAVSALSVKDETEYFTGGGVDFWTLEGFNPQTNNYIYWDNINENIVFEDAPSNPRVEIRQNINIDYNAEGFKYRVKFDYNLSQGKLRFYYYSSNSNNEGFRSDNPNFYQISGSGQFNQLLTIDQEIDLSSNDNLLDTFVLYTEDGPVSGTVDNFSIQREIEGFDQTTISYSEATKGWVSFKSFIPENGVSIDKKYITFKGGLPYEHYTNSLRNYFYGELHDSMVEVLLNQSPSTIKSFNTLSYEGSQGKISTWSMVDGINNASTQNVHGGIQGWQVDPLIGIVTDQDKGSISEFKEKEGKWFSSIMGAGGFSPIKSDMPASFNFQGLGEVGSVAVVDDPNDPNVI